jgi:hypothetical protein
MTVPTSPSVSKVKFNLGKYIAKPYSIPNSAEGGKWSSWLSSHERTRGKHLSLELVCIYRIGLTVCVETKIMQLSKQLQSPVFRSDE